MALGKGTDGPVSRYLNRRVSTRITGFLVSRNVPITPNQVSLLSLLLSLAAALLVAWGELLIGGILVQVSSIVDGVDGELARARGVASPVGGFVDAVLDRFADFAVLMATGLQASVVQGEWGLAAASWAIFASIMVSYVHARGEASLGKHPLHIGVTPSFASRDVRLFILFIGLVAGQPYYTLVVVAALSTTYVVLKTLDVYGTGNPA